MQFILFGIIFLLLLFLIGHLLLKADPRVLAKQVRPVGIGFAILFAVVLTLTGRWWMARRLLAAAFGVLGGTSPFGASYGGAGPGGAKRRPGTSRVRTALLEMELDHATGEMHGLVIAGRFIDRSLSDLGPSELAVLLGECTAAGDQSEAVLAAWLDRNHPDWRTDSRFADGADAGRGKGEGGGQRAAMSRDEACEVLGVEPGASDDDIRKAHKRLMKQFHPDQGGSDYLASKINEAKDVLLGR